MRMKILFSMFLLLPLLSLGQQRWEKLIDDGKYTSIGNTSSYDKGFLIKTRLDGSGSKKNIIFKLNKNGEEMWRKYLFFDNWTVPDVLKQNANGDMILAGETGGKASLVYLDACGDMVWCNTFINNHYIETFYTNAIILDNNNIIGLVMVRDEDNDYDMGLIAFNPDGDFLWFHPFNLQQQFNLGNAFIFFNLKSFNNYIIVSGWFYYAYPDKPNLGLLKPVFIKTDTSYFQDWVLIYGLADSSVNDTVLGDAYGVVSCQNNILHGFGRTSTPTQQGFSPALMYFDTLGNETSYYTTDNETINSSTDFIYYRGLSIRDDTTYFASLNIGDHVGEAIMDTTGIVLQHQEHPEAKLISGMFPMAKDTASNQYYLSYESNDNNWNIMLYKFNADLSDAETDTLPHNYDTLCPNLPITSDTIYVTGCGLITALSEFPSPEAWQQAKQTVELTAYPNPVSGNTVNFKLKYIRYHDNMQLTVYDISGRLLVTLPITSGAKTATLSITGFSPGMHVAVVRDNKKVLGKAVFSVVE